MKFIWVACITYFVNGLLVVMLGPVMPEILTHYHLSYTAGGYLVLTQSLGFLIGVPLSAWVIGKFGFKSVLATLSICVAMTVSAIICLPPIWLLALLCFTIGTSVAASESAIATFTMESFVGRRAVAMSYLEVAFGLGALVMPAVASFFVKIQLWSWSFSVAVALAIVTAITWTTLSLERSNSATNEPLDAENAPSVVTSRSSKLLILSAFLVMIFLYVGTESSLGNFLPTLFIPYLHVPSYIAALSVATLWGAMVIGRMLTGWLIRKIAYAHFLFWSIVGAIVTLVFLSFIRVPLISYGLVFLIGLFLSGIYSITLVYANHTMPNSAKLVTGLVTIFAGLGGAILPALVGATMSHAPIRSGLWLCTGFMVVMFIFLVGIVQLPKLKQVAKRQTVS